MKNLYFIRVTERDSSANACLLQAGLRMTVFGQAPHDREGQTFKNKANAEVKE